jgi:hypothetical protein
VIRSLSTAALVLTLATPVHAGFEPGQWRHRKAIRIESGVAPYAQVYLDGETYSAGAVDLGDLRVVSDVGEEVPYVFQRWEGSQTEKAVETTMFNRSVLPGRFTRFELRVADVRSPHTRIHLEVEQRDFRRRVTVEGSDDRRTWLLLSNDTVYRFQEVASAERTTITYPEALYRFLRVTLEDEGATPLTVRAASVIFDEVVPAREDRWLNGATESVVDRQARTTAIRVDLGFSGLPVSRLAVRIPSPASFAREAEVSISNDGATWQSAGQAALFRAQGVPLETPIGLSLREVRGRHVRVSINNADNSPVRVDSAAVFGIRRSLLFPIEVGRSYYLYLGGNAPSPQYDLPQIIGRGTAAPRSLAAVLGPIEPNPVYVLPTVRRPWTEENPALLWGVMATVIVVLGVLIIRTARKAGSF